MRGRRSRRWTEAAARKSAELGRRGRRNGRHGRFEAPRLDSVVEEVAGDTAVLVHGFDSNGEAPGEGTTVATTARPPVRAGGGGARARGEEGKGEEQVRGRAGGRGLRVLLDHQ